MKVRTFNRNKAEIDPAFFIGKINRTLWRLERGCFLLHFEWDFFGIFWWDVHYLSTGLRWGMGIIYCNSTFTFLLFNKIFIKNVLLANKSVEATYFSTPLHGYLMTYHSRTCHRKFTWNFPPQATLIIIIIYMPLYLSKVPDCVWYKVSKQSEILYVLTTQMHWHKQHYAQLSKLSQYGRKPRQSIRTLRDRKHHSRI